MSARGKPNLALVSVLIGDEWRPRAAILICRHKETCADRSEGNETTAGVNYLELFPGVCSRSICNERCKRTARLVR